MNLKIGCVLIHTYTLHRYESNTSRTVTQLGVNCKAGERSSIWGHSRLAINKTKINQTAVKLDWYTSVGEREGSYWIQNWLRPLAHIYPWKGMKLSLLVPSPNKRFIAGWLSDLALWCNHLKEIDGIEFQKKVPFVIASISLERYKAVSFPTRITAQLRALVGVVTRQKQLIKYIFEIPISQKPTIIHLSCIFISVLE